MIFSLNSDIWFWHMSEVKKQLNAFFGRSPICSMFNMNEIAIVMDYIKKLLTPGNHRRVIYPSDIGVVTPYKMQRRCIAQACNRLKFDDITIGTAEVFQGQEKPVMIVSTVRSGGNRLGFVNNPRVCWLFRCSVNSIVPFEKKHKFQSNLLYSTLSAIQCDDHTCQMPSHCSRRSSAAPAGRKLEKTNQLLLGEQSSDPIKWLTKKRHRLTEGFDRHSIAIVIFSEFQSYFQRFYVIFRFFSWF